MHRQPRGLTLIELMTTLVVVGLLASIAVPGYRQVMLRAGRSEAKVELLQTASALERCYSRYNAFNSPQCAGQVVLPRLTESGRYQIVAASLEEGDYSLRALPQGGQADDHECRTLSYDSAGHKGVTDGAAKTAGYCWSR